MEPTEAMEPMEPAEPAVDGGDVEKGLSHDQTSLHKLESELPSLDTPSLYPADEIDPTPVTKTVTAQDWTGPDDPENPMNWPLWKRCYNTAATGLLAFAVTYGSSVYTPGYPGVEAQFGVSDTVALLPLSLYTLGLAFGPMLGAPLSEAHGRRIVYWTSVPLSMFFTLGSGFSQTITQLNVCRFFAGVFGSPVLAVGAGTNADLWPTHRRARAVSVFLMAPFLGPALGPFIGGFSFMTFSWRWTQWDMLFVTVPIYVAALFMKETYKKTILQKRAKRLNIPMPVNNGPKSGFEMVKALLLVTLARPIDMIIKEPIVAFFSIYIAFNFAVLFAFFAAFPIVFQGVYGFNSGESGLTFLAVGLGVVTAVGTTIALDKYVYTPKHQRVLSEGGTMVAPEHRLYGAMIGSFGLPISLFWFAWTSRQSIHWAVPLIGTIPFGVGNTLVFISSSLYTVDVYGPRYGASALGANGLARYIAGAAFPLFTIPMYETLGIGWATSLFGFISVALLPIPWILFKFGPRIRARSSYVPVTK